ncbi:MAG: LacI family DNA-binding transcriptional regulator [Bacteroidota bacterium]|jgi:LacI family transcriptional regulator
MKRRPTIQDVAKETSLSISTVSLVLNNQPHVSDETRRKVLQAIAELGYYPHRGARGLASRLTGNIGFIISDDHFTQVEPFYTRIFLGTEFESRDHDYYVLLTTVSKRFNKKNPSVPRYLLERNVDGVIIAGRISEALVEHIDKLALPMVLVDYALKRRRISSVLIDNRSGVRAAILHLIQGGHREIAFIGGDLQHPSIAERYEAYKKTLEENNLTCRPSLVVTDETDTRVHNGYNAAGRLLKQEGKPTAIFAANDAMAIGCMRYLKAVGKEIPDDVAVVGFDDIEMSSHVEPRLTTVRVPKEEMGKLAVRLLVGIIKSKVETITTVHVPVELVVRESSDTGQDHEVRNTSVSLTLDS